MSVQPLRVGVIGAGTVGREVVRAFLERSPRLAPVDGKRVRLAVDDASWPRLVEWVSAAQSLHGLVAERATVEALPAAGRVKAELVLVAP